MRPHLRILERGVYRLSELGHDGRRRLRRVSSQSPPRSAQATGTKPSSLSVLTILPREFVRRSPGSCRMRSFAHALQCSKPFVELLMCRGRSSFAGPPSRDK
jgi:hypothetical protein